MFTLLPLLALSCSLVLYIQGTTRHQNVPHGAPWVGEVDLLQYHYGVLDVPMPEVG